MTDAAPVLSMRGLVKRFGGVRALDGANFEVRPGTIHGLVGQNGAGKSTLIKILAGIYRQDAGSIEIAGRRQEHLTPRSVEKLGIHFIHQDRLLVPTFTVGEAMFLGREPRVAGLPLLGRRGMQRRAAEILRRDFDIELPAGALIGELTAAQQQTLQISRALLDQPKVLVFDEPTAALVRREVATLFRIIRRLREQGISIVYISHYMQEIEELCDRVTVLRNGKDVGTVDPRVTPSKEIVSMMIARDIQEMFPVRRPSLGKAVLETKGLGRTGSFAEVSLTLRQGEILGVTGLLGSGVKELMRCLFGLTRADAGSIVLGGGAAALRSPVAAVDRRLAMVPEDRRTHGVALDLSVKENMTLASLKQFTRGGLLNLKAERKAVDQLIERLAIRTGSRDSMVRQLSGGNQQKVVLAKWLRCQSSVYLLDEPTVGVDVGSKVEIYQLLADLAAQGAGILILSTDLLELLGLCDRILVMYRGRIVRDFDVGQTDSDELLVCATGAMAA